MRKSIKLPMLHCLRCQYDWPPRKTVEPKRCPRCGSPYWNKLKWKWKFALKDRVVANEKAPGDYAGKFGTVMERGPGKVEYGIRFDGQEGIDYLNSWWLDKLK